MDDACIAQAISLCKKIVSSFSYSWKKRRELAEVQMQLGLPGHQLITEAATRWGSRLLMIERVLEQERALAKVLSADQTSCPYLAGHRGSEHTKTTSRLQRCTFRRELCDPLICQTCPTPVQH